MAQQNSTLSTLLAHGFDFRVVEIRPHVVQLEALIDGEWQNTKNKAENAVIWQKVRDCLEELGHHDNLGKPFHTAIVDYACAKFEAENE